MYDNTCYARVFKKYGIDYLVCSSNGMIIRKPNEQNVDLFFCPVCGRLLEYRTVMMSMIKRSSIGLLVDIPYMVTALSEAENALTDYIDQLEKQGATCGYGRSVVKLIRKAISGAMEP